ncbi:beta-glucosidase BglX [Chimaeribacter californicus]|uniref:Periplasmic beta-glucosidase n=1 Tax=Chimaeribacter californicus TaxID=2060067 RepID=A0A2N5E546_9GAMM|nr:beta-glucosidase BglX [Chimaeribacter californicus]PLR36260.1 beta-glucosidase BglX [Chimaeribacter californicus]
MNKRCLLGILFCLAVSPVYAEPVPPAPQYQVKEKAAFIDHLLKQMTLDEKIGQLNLVTVGPEYPKEAIMADIRAGKVGGMFNTVTKPDIRRMQDQVQHSRLKIPLFYAYDVVHGQRTIFPISLGLAASWDMDAVALSGRISAIETAADGLNMTFSPMVDITRDARWGRVSEGFGEDTYLTSRLADVLVKAYQGDDPSAPDRIMANVKHYATYGAAEGGRDYNTVDMSLPKMFQDYLPPYKAAIDAGAGGVMVSLNAVNAIPATSNSWLLSDILRKQWHFRGVTVSDHGAIGGLVKHGVAENNRQAAAMALKAGVDMDMADNMYGLYLKGLLKDGLISQRDIDRAVRDVLDVKWDMGLFADAYRHLGPASTDPADTNAESRLHRKEAREVARTAMVLLKNRAQTLPLAKNGTIAVIGPLAKSQRDIMGSWSAAGVSAQTVTVWQGMQNVAGGKANLLYARGANVTDDQAIVDYLNSYDKAVVNDPRPAQVMIDEAVSVAKKADVVVAVVGESQGMAHEASSRSDITIPESQRDLLKALKATGKPLVLVLMNGRPLALPWENDNADAILETWFSGTEGGNAVADVLFGDYNPSGKLPMTFPRAVGQVPLYYNVLNTGRPFNPQKPDKYTSRYFDITNGPLYPFGYGLSYTRFSVSDITLSSASLTHKGNITASVTVKNTGDRAGATVVQLYLQDVTASLARPVKELKNFKKINLQPGEQQVVTFPIDETALRFFNNQLNWVSEPGRFNVFIGLDSQDVKKQSFLLTE